MSFECAFTKNVIRPPVLNISSTKIRPVSRHYLILTPFRIKNQMFQISKNRTLKVLPIVAGRIFSNRPLIDLIDKNLKHFVSHVKCYIMSYINVLEPFPNQMIKMRTNMRYSLKLKPKDVFRALSNI